MKIVTVIIATLAMAGCISGSRQDLHHLAWMYRDTPLASANVARILDFLKDYPAHKPDSHPAKFSGPGAPCDFYVYIEDLNGSSRAILYGSKDHFVGLDFHVWCVVSNRLDLVQSPIYLVQDPKVVNEIIMIIKAEVHAN